jgi:hypothetical protein
MPVLRAPVKGQKLVLSFGKPSVKGIKYLPLPTDFKSQKVSSLYKNSLSTWVLSFSNKKV